VRGAGTRLYRARPYPARPYRTRLYHPAGMQPEGLDRVLYIQIAWLAKACSPPPPRAPISRFCITRKEYNSTLLFAGGLPSQEDRSFQKTQSSGRGTAWVSALGTVAGRSEPGPAEGFPRPGQAPTSRPGPQGPVRSCEAAWRPVPPFKGRSDHLHPGRRPRQPWAAAEPAISPRGYRALRPRRDRAAWRRSARLRPRRCPRRPRRQLRPRTRPGAGAPLDPGGNRRRPVPCRATASPDRTSRRAAGNGLGQGRGDLAFASHAICTYNRQHSANTASCQRSFLPA
jgi:hypothetical protein